MLAAGMFLTWGLTCCGVCILPAAHGEVLFGAPSGGRAIEPGGIPLIWVVARSKNQRCGIVNEC